MRPWVKKVALVLVFSTLACCASLCIILFFYDPVNPPPWSLNDLLPGMYYEITPASILTDIENGHVEDAFRWIDVKPTTFPEIYPAGSFLWKQEDYIKIVNAHLFYQTGETMADGWRVYTVYFLSKDCRDEIGFDWAEIRLFKQVWWGYDGMVVDIRPLEGILAYGRGEYGLLNWYTPSKVVESDMAADEAWQIAEQAVGKEMRQKLTDTGCEVSVYDFGNDEYWDVVYRWGTHDLSFTLYADVNPNDGQYSIRSHVHKCERTICP